MHIADDEVRRRGRAISNTNARYSLIRIARGKNLIAHAGSEDIRTSIKRIAAAERRVLVIRRDGERPCAEIQAIRATLIIESTNGAVTVTQVDRTRIADAQAAGALE